LIVAVKGGCVDHLNIVFNMMMMMMMMNE